MGGRNHIGSVFFNSILSWVPRMKYRQNIMNVHQDGKMSLFYNKFLVRFRDVMSIYFVRSCVRLPAITVSCFLWVLE